MEGYRRKKKKKKKKKKNRKKYTSLAYALYCIRKYLNRFMNVFKGFYYNRKEYRKKKKVYPHSLALITVYRRRRKKYTSFATLSLVIIVYKMFAS